MRVLNEFQNKQLDKAGALAKAQLKMAIEITDEVMANDQRLLDGAVLAAVVEAIATNLAHSVSGG